MDKRATAYVSDFNSELKLKGFKAYQIETDQKTRIYSRKDFYKICLVTGSSIINYAERGIKVEGTTLFFGTPHIPYSWELVTQEQMGYTCLFSEQFLKEEGRSILKKSPLFKIGGTPIFHLSEDQRTHIASIFQKMMEEQQTDYIYKKDLIRNYIHLLIHEALKLQPSDNFYHHQDASSRITSMFLELLERQFPVESVHNPLNLRSPKEFADSLAVHVNHLNRSVKKVTGKPTSVHISERIITEAKALLTHTDWDIAEIANSLGFEQPTYFNNFFKKNTNSTPSNVRQQADV